MKTIITLFTFLLLPIFLFSQNKNEYRKYTRYYFKHINWNDKEYENHTKSLEIMLKDLEEIDFELFQTLNTDYNKYKQKVSAGNRVILCGVTVGAVCYGVLYLKDFSVRQTEFLFIGTLISIFAGLGIGSGMKPNSRRYFYNFTKRLNKNKLGKKVKYSVRPEIGLGNNSFVGLSFSLNF